MAASRPKLSDREFDAIVQQAMDRIPVEIRQHLNNMLITVQRRPTAEMLAEVGLGPDETLFGLYWGVPMTERSIIDPPLYPDTIYLFQEPLEQMCADREMLIEEIEITLVHELAHALGLSDAELDALGYA
ncbi:metallopeptidase family protein [Desulfatitalea alkaliphila]|uniref:Metallopeptidase family protein n=1 Tax=Desulfatitalea alkaliphila TaxID=2929485 RepID=A0AA41R1S3_9BACT|nr:metallopeptidase family protein [Desulfatitalea alkaliphila]MCJ8500914.1 metallopeptidase family protein [Desulfatitalea alkaliphila]